MQISGLVALAFKIYYLVLMARVILSWIRVPSYGLLGEYVAPFVYKLTEPLLRPLRQALHRYQGGVPLDFSPMLLFLLLMVAENIILSALYTAGL